MPNGWFSLMMSFWKPGNTELLLPAVMELNDGSFHEYLHILRTTLRSRCSLPFYYTSNKLNYDNRILLACIRKWPALCPCPRCCTPLSSFHKLGTAADMRRRVKLARVDNFSRQNSVFAARKLIYHNHQQVTSAAVDRLLKETSLVPNIVCASP
jgi:hypothetical protein